MKSTLNERQSKVLELLRRESVTGNCPSVREICEKTGIASSSTVWRIIKSLEDKGFIAVSRNSARGITLLSEDGYVLANLPIITDLDPITGKAVTEKGFLPFTLPEKMKSKSYAVTAVSDIAEIKKGDTAVFVYADIVPDGFLAAVRTAKGIRIGAVFHREEGSFVHLEGNEYRIGGEADIAVVGRIIGFVRKFI